MSMLDYSCYRTVEEIYIAMQALATNNPTLATWLDIGDSWEKGNVGDPTFPSPSGYDIKVLKVTNSTISVTKPVLLLTGGIHARELAGAETVTRFAEYLLANYNVDPDITWIVNYCEVHIIPLVNPDGHKWVEVSPDHWSWRKNVNISSCYPPGGGIANYGVDLNRNFLFKWGVVPSVTPCGETYQGPSAASEPEVQAIQTYMGTIFTVQRGPLDTDPAPDTATGLSVSLHSYGKYVIWPWPWTVTPPPNATQLQTLGRKIAYFNNYTPQQMSQLYLHSGTEQDYVYGHFGVAAIGIELGENAFLQDCYTYTGTVYIPNLNALLYAAKAARRPYQTPAGPDVTDLVISPTSVKSGDPTTLTGIANDKRYYPTGVEPSQEPTEARYSIDAPSWVPGTTTYPVALGAISGDLYRKNLSANISTSGLSPGKHTIFVESKDASGNWGATSAIFVTILPSTSMTIEVCNIGLSYGADLRGYAYGCVDQNGKIYFAPCYTTYGPPQTVHGWAVRFNPSTESTGFKTAPPYTGTGWEICNLAAGAGNSGAIGFHGAAYVNNFVYYAPLWTNANPLTNSGTVTRIPIATFTSASVQTFDISDPASGLPAAFLNAKGYVGVISDGRYLYFVPYSSDPYTPVFHGLAVRYDSQGLGPSGEAASTLAAFKNPTNWKLFDLSTKSSAAKGYHLGCYDGSRWIYFAPGYNSGGGHGDVVRYDTLGDPAGFTDPTRWEVFDVRSLSAPYTFPWHAAQYFYGCVAVGKWIYFVNNRYISLGAEIWNAVVRYNSTLALNDSSAWQIVNTFTLLPGAGFAGCCTDGTYVYITPDFKVVPGTGNIGYGIVSIHDSRVSDLTTGWETIDMGLPYESYHGNVIYGGYVYNIPLRDFSVPNVMGTPNAYASRYTAKSAVALPVTHIVTTEVTGLQVKIDGTSYTAPHTVSWMSGEVHSLEAPLSQVISGNTKYFDHWEDNTKGSIRSVTGKSYSVTYIAYYIDTNPEMVPAPSTPSGPITGEPGISYSYNSSILTPCNATHIEKIRFDWGDGNISSFMNSTYNQSHGWVNTGTYYIKAQAECETTLKQSDWSAPLQVNINPGSHLVPMPSVSGENSGIVGTPYTATVSYTLCQSGHTESFRFDWGDTVISDWGSVSQTHTWTSPNTYSVKVQAKCNVTGNTSSWSVAKSVNVSGHQVSTPTAPTGPTTGTVGNSYSYNSTVPLCLAGHSMQMKFDWGDGTFSDWVAVVSTQALSSHTWTAEGTYQVKVQAKCITTGEVSLWSDALVVIISAAADVVGAPGTPTSADSSYQLGISYSFSTTFTHSAHPTEIQINFDWGDGSSTGYLNAAVSPFSGSHTWSVAGTYQIRTRAKCKTSGAESAWSGILTITISGGTHFVPIPTTVAGGRIPYYLEETPDLELKGVWNFLCEWARCQSDHTLLLQMDFGDGSYSSGWIDPSKLVLQYNLFQHYYKVSGSFYVKIRAKCKETGILSGWSDSLRIDVTEVHKITSKVSAKPLGSSTGTGGTLYSFDASQVFGFHNLDNMLINLGLTPCKNHNFDYRFCWGDGRMSGWGAASQNYSWFTSGTFYVRVQAKCSVTGVTSGWSYPASIKITGEGVHSILPPSIPIGPGSGVALTSYSYSATYTLCQAGHTVQMRFDWGDGTLSDWSDSSASQSHSWSSGGTYDVLAQVKCINTGAISSWSDALVVIIGGVDAIATPSVPVGPISGSVGTLYSYTSTISHVHTAELKFDWGDGTYSSWTDPLAQQSHSWSANGTYLVKAQARCTVSGLISGWSAGLTVVIGPFHTVPTPGTPSGPTSGVTGTSYAYTSTWSQCPTPSHGIQTRFDWGDGTLSDFQTATSPPTAVNHTWNTKGTYSVKAQAKCVDTGVTSTWSSGLTITITLNLGGHDISAPGVPSGPDTGSPNTGYSYSASWTPCSISTHLYYMKFDWGDGVVGSWQSVVSGITTIFQHSWTVAGSYFVKAQVKCTSGGVDTAISSWGSALTVTIGTGGETITAPGVPSGPTTLSPGVGGSYTVVTPGVSSLGHDLEYQFDWSNGDLSHWDYYMSGTYAWMTTGDYLVRVRGRCGVDTTAISNWSTALDVHVTLGGETVSPPTILNGPSSGGTNTSYTYTTGGSVSSLGHNLQYMFKWGDGSDSGWLAVGILFASHSWTTTGTYIVQALARCFTHGIQSAAKSIGVTIGVAGETISTPLTPTGLPIIGIGADESYTTTRGVISSAGHSCEIQFDWGDGTYSSWDSMIWATHSWSIEGVYFIRARGRCSIHTSIMSEWSDTFAILVTAGFRFLWQVTEAVTNNGFCHTVKGDGSVVYFGGMENTEEGGYELVPVVGLGTSGRWRIEKRIARTGVFELGNYDTNPSIVSSCKRLGVEGNYLYGVGFEHTIFPQCGNLIAWYKFNEGSGAVAINSAIDGSLGGGLIPNSTVADPDGDFWTYFSGFASVPRRTGSPNGRAYISSPRDISIGGSGFTYGVFVRYKPLPLSGFGHIIIPILSSGKLNYWGNSGTELYEWYDHTLGNSSTFLANPLTITIEEWIFYYITNDRRLARVRSNGTRQLGTQFSTFTQTAIDCFRIGSGSAVCNEDTANLSAQASWGDWIIYNNTTLTDAEWGQWYDMLRSRYGMAARSGW